MPTGGANRPPPLLILCRAGGVLGEQGEGYIVLNHLSIGVEN